MRYTKKFTAAAIIFLSIAACQTPEERATGEKGGSKDDSMKNSQPMTDPYAPPNNTDTTNIPDTTDTTRNNHSSIPQ